MCVIGQIHTSALREISFHKEGLFVGFDTVLSVKKPSTIEFSERFDMDLYFL